MVSAKLVVATSGEQELTEHTNKKTIEAHEYVDIEFDNRMDILRLSKSLVSSLLCTTNTSRLAN